MYIIVIGVLNNERNYEYCIFRQNKELRINPSKPLLMKRKKLKPKSHKTPFQVRVFYHIYIQHF